MLFISPFDTIVSNEIFWNVLQWSFLTDTNGKTAEVIVNKNEIHDGNGLTCSLEEKIEQKNEVKDKKLSNSNSTNPYQPGDWVVVRYDDLLYPGEVISLPSNGIEINAMEPTTCGSYKWPTRKDVHTYLLEDVVKKIEPPIPCGSRASQFTFKDSF